MLHGVRLKTRAEARVYILFLFRYQFPQQRGCTLVPAAATAAPSAGTTASATTTAATASCDVEWCATLFILFIEPRTLLGSVLDDRVCTASSGAVNDRLAVCIEGIHIHA